MKIVMKIKRLASWLGIAASALVVAACGGGGGTDGGDVTAQPMGSLRVALTDAPSCGFDAVNITVSRVRVHASSTADDNAMGWHDLAVSPARKMNLLDLTNGVLEELGQIALPAGSYTQVRLVLQPNGGGTPSNSVVPTGGSEQALFTPSATQSGTKLIHPFTVPAGGLADLVLDFDACKSIVERGNGTFGLKPVIAVSPRFVAEIVGYVDPTLSGVRISAQVNGVVKRSTVPDATGAFKLAFLDPAAPVDVVFAAPAHATAVIAGVPIVLQSTTPVSTAAAPVTLPPSGERTASGTVLPAAAMPGVRALQAVGAVAQVEVAAVNADAAGAYTLVLPTAAPLLAPFTTPLPAVFTSQPPNAAKYRLEASADGYVTQQSPLIDLGAANATVDFTLVPAP